MFLKGTINGGFTLYTYEKDKGSVSGRTDKHQKGCDNRTITTPNLSSHLIRNLDIMLTYKWNKNAQINHLIMSDEVEQAKAKSSTGRCQFLKAFSPPQLG